ncbi:hypothetical protein [Gordonia sp. MP11Mi]|uniref:Uncharacterized protein n=1 Tax=Gordonia sp. MP11Mi TaxID=3022769 RepID=A0AA97CYW4_9ACTN
MTKLDKHQLVPLTSAELESLREAAHIHDATNGIFSRALLQHAMAHLDDPEVQESIAEEKRAAAQRLSDGAKRAVAHRWGARP